MIQEDDQAKYKHDTDLVEYLASFWNAEAVQKIRNSRDNIEDERFASDEEFEKQIFDEEFKKNHELVKSLKDKNTNLQGNNDDRPRDARSVRMPKDMSRLFNIAKD
jgi:hypothetical protein